MKRLTKGAQIAKGALTVAGCVVIAAAVHAKEPGVSDKEIVLGAVAGYTGPIATLSYALNLGVRLAAEEINASGGINGRRIKAVVEDDQYVPAKSVQALQKLIDVDDIFALVGISGGSHGLAMMPLIDKFQIPTINPAVTTEAHFAPNRNNVFGIGMTYATGAYDQLKMLDKLHPKQKWGSLVQDDDSGAAREAGYDRAIKETGAESVFKQRFKPRQMDFSAEILRAKAVGVTAMQIGGLPAVNAAIIAEARKQGLKVVVAGLWTDHTPQTLELLGPEGDGMYVYDFVPSVTDKAAAGGFMALVQRYLPKDDQPKVNRYTMLSYIGTKMMAKAITDCGKEVTRACVSAQIEKTQNFSVGFGTPVSFGPGVRLSAPGGVLMKVDLRSKQFVPVR